MPRYLSICSGIEAVTQAWHPLGWRPLAFAEIEPFPAAVLAHRHPSVPNLGDFTRYDQWPIDTLLQTDLLVGGTPCQAFSVAGLRQSLQDDRGNLTLTLVKLYDLITQIRHTAGRPAPLLVWENVPGVLNTPDNAFGCFLAALAGENDPLLPPGGRWKNAGYVRGPSRAIAWRILDAQYFGLAQRRRRVFLVAGPRDHFRPEQVLFEWHSLRRDTPPSRKAGQDPTGTLSARTEGGGGLGTDFECSGGVVPEEHPTLAFGGNNTTGPIPIPIPIASALSANRGTHNPGDFEAGTLLLQEVAGTLLNGGKTAGSATNQDAESGLLIPETCAPLTTNPYSDNLSEEDKLIPETAHTLRAEGFDASEDGTGRGTPLVATGYRTSGNWGAYETGDGVDALTTGTDRSSHLLTIPIDMWQASRGATMTNNRREGSSGGAPGTGIGEPGDPAPTVSTSHIPAIAYAIQERAVSENPAAGPDGIGVRSDDCAYTLEARQVPQAIAFSASSYAVRRLTPRECERLQGFPDDHTLIPWRGKPAADGPRYKALGNSMAVPVMRWIGERINLITTLSK